MNRFVSIAVLILIPLIFFQSPDVYAGCRVEIFSGLTVVKLAGTPYEMGYFQGKHLKNQIHGNMLSDGIFKLINGSRKKSVIKYLRKIEKIIPSKYLDEMRGMAEGLGIGYDTILAFNLNIEIWLGTFRIGCTNAGATGGATHQKKVIHLRTMDANHSDYDMVVSFYVNNDEISFCSVVPAGYVGVFSGMNTRKITVSDNLDGSIVKFDPEGVPLAIFRRILLEKAENLGDVHHMIKTTTPAIPNDIMVSDGNTNQLRVYEVLPDDIFRKTKPKNDIICSVNSESYERRRFVERFLGQGRRKLTVADFVELAREDAICKYPGYRGNPRIKNLATVIFVPNDFNFWVALRPKGNRRPSSYNQFVGFNLLKECGLSASADGPTSFKAK